MKTQSAPLSDERLLKKALGYSAGFHAILFTVFAVRAVFYSGDAILLDDAIRVDMVALPDKKSAEIPDLNPPPTAPQKTKVPEKAAEKPAPAPKPEPPKISLDRTKKDQAAALKRLEALERLEKQEKKPVQKPKAPDVGEAQPSTVVKGNQVSQGNSLTGLTRLEHRGYLSSVQAQVKRYWRLPNWMSNQNYSARVRIWVDANGNVIKKQLLRSSGSSEFDERAMAAVEAAGRLPAPPTDLANLLAVDGLDADFP